MEHLELQEKEEQEKQAEELAQVNTYILRWSLLWRRGLVGDTWLWDQEVPGSSPGCARSTLSPWERLFTCIPSPHSCVKRVPHYR